jgi:hypothetical protein
MSAIFGDAVATLKRDLGIAIQNEVRKFSEKTGIEPSRIEVPCIEATSLADQTRRYIIGEITVGFTEY